MSEVLKNIKEWHHWLSAEVCNFSWILLLLKVFNLDINCQGILLQHEFVLQGSFSEDGS